MKKDILEEIQQHRYSEFEVLSGEPSRFARYTVYLLAVILLGILVWSIIAKAPVIVQSVGTLQPKASIRQIYTPVNGYASEILISVGQPVKAGDIVLRLRSTDVFELSKRSEQARLKYETALEQQNRNAEERPVLQRQIENVEASIADIDAELQLQQRDRKFRLSQIQQLRLDKINASINATRSDRDKAYKKWQSLEKLLKQGAIAEREVSEARNTYNQQKRQHDAAKNALLEYELNLSTESRQNREALRGLADRLDGKNRDRDDLFAKMREMDRLDRTLASEVKLAQLDLELASKVSFNDIDSNGLLLVRAPVDGVIASSNLKQTGQLVDATTALATIAPANSEKELHIAIPENNRLFLREGMAARIKFNAMDYRKYGVVNGRLRFISPNAQVQQQAAQSSSQSSNRAIYRGKVDVFRDGLSLGGQFYPLQYGMQATAEIVVRERRLIDVVLDPMRQVVQ